MRLPVLDGSEIDEVFSALHFGFRIGLVGWRSVTV